MGKILFIFVSAFYFSIVMYHMKWRICYAHSRLLNMLRFDNKQKSSAICVYIIMILYGIWNNNSPRCF